MGCGMVAGLSGRTGARCGGNSLSCIGATCLPDRKASICCGSRGRPGCSDIAGRIRRNGIVGGGGVALVINLGGLIRVEGCGFLLASGGGVLAEFPAGLFCGF